MVEAQKNQAKAQNDTDKVMLDAMKQADAEQQAYANGEQAGYEQGASDGVDAALGR
jgi:flagellar biosynthesis/type III secretory pathway protein FliH